jgi:hypothetical protein
VLRMSVRFACLVVLSLGCAAAMAQEFSADAVSLKGNEKFNKVYVGKDKVRIEGMGTAGGMGPNAVIVDQTQNKNIALMGERRMYMEVPLNMRHSLFELWHVSDVDDACPQWKKAVDDMKTDSKWGTCTKVGSDTLNGRSSVKYKGTSTDGKTTYIWVDEKLHAVTKWQNDENTMEFRNIKEGPQPASLFEVPAGYQKFDMGSYMQHH